MLMKDLSPVVKSGTTVKQIFKGVENMSLFGGMGKNCFGGDDTILWFIILFLLIFCCNNNSCGIADNSSCCC